MRTAVFSIISPNYRHFARVLMESLRRHHPEWDRFVLLVGETTESEEEVALEELNLPHARQFCFRYTILELNTAVKPWMFEHLFARGYDRVIYFDPDIMVYSRLEELPDAFLVLTPHLTGSIGGDHHPSERATLLSGAYNLGFLSVSRHASLERFLAWWKEKLEFQCVVDPAQGLFVDQKWMDLAPGLFPDVAILRHDGYNVAYWNLEQRSVQTRGTHPTVNGEPLRFFHFSGFDPALPHLVSKHYDDRRLADIGEARTLFEDYAAALHEADHRRFRGARYPFGFFTDGAPVPDAARIAYRNDPELQALCGEDPFAHSERFVGRRDKRRRTHVETRARLLSYRLLSGARPLVQLVPRTLRTRLRELVLGRKERVPHVSRPAVVPGINIVGYLGRETGVGESARLAAKACEAAGLARHLIDIDADAAPQPAYRATVFHVNADQVPIVHNQLARLFETSAYNVGVWHWELPELPDRWISSADPLDEIWAPSAFIQSAISRKVTIPVVHMPHGVAVTEIEACSPEELGVPRGRFTFLCMFDLGSIAQRKNPLGAVEAFRRAFPDHSNAALLIKVSGSANHRDEYARLEEELRGLPEVHVTDRMLSRRRVNGLLSACDAIVSLHRSEGFGLILAEAMCVGRPVVATGWSGNMDFMNGANSCPVNYELVTLEQTITPYDAGQRWAEPDVEHAAHLMRQLVTDSAYRRQISEHARETMRREFSPAAAGLRYERRLALAGLMNQKSHRPG